MRGAWRSKQEGTAAIEFAALFGILFFVAYGAISYALVMLLQQSLVQAASEGARAAAGKLSYIRFVSTSSRDEELKKLATTAATTSLSWLPENIRTHITGTGISATWQPQSVEVNTASGTKQITMDALTVTVTYAGYYQRPLLPILRFPGLGNIPGVPDNLVGRATVTP